MKKNIVPKVIFLVLAIILIISIVYVFTKEKKNRTLMMYDKICNQNIYTFSIIEENSDINYSLTIAKKDNYTSIDAKSNEEHTTTLVKDDIAYYIMHNEKSYYLYDSNGIDADILISDLSGLGSKKYTSGHEKINGKDYYYEEYDGITAFIMWSNYSEDESVIKTRFYFDGDNINYIKTTIDSEEEILKVEFLNDVNESLFEIPDNYAEL